VAVRKIEGVEAVEVSLNEGLAVIRFGAANDVTVDDVRQIIRRNGFTPKTAEIRVAGTVKERDGRLTLTTGGEDRAYALRESPGSPGVLAQLAQAESERLLVVEGLVPEPGDDGEGSWTLVVRRFSNVPVPTAHSGPTVFRNRR